MLRTRLWMGSILIALTAGMLVGDQFLAPWFPFLFLFQVGLGLLGCLELVHLLGPERAPQKPIAFLGVLVMGCANWAGHLPGMRADPWLWLLGAFAGLNLLVFVFEMATLPQFGRCTERMANTLLIIAYLGLLPSFLAQERWLFTPVAGSFALALTIFVPKMCDSGAYFTGRLLGKHKMTPVLSPKKTWEGAAGGFAFAVLTAVLLDQLAAEAPLGRCWVCEIGFGLSVGLAGMLGDLAESLLKRDCQKKDASAVVPGFGGILDVVDAVIFAAPVAFAWFVLGRG